jgi:hypothetical protein
VLKKTQFERTKSQKKDFFKSTPYTIIKMCHDAGRLLLPLKQVAKPKKKMVFNQDIL